MSTLNYCLIVPNYTGLLIVWIFPHMQNFRSQMDEPRESCKSTNPYPKALGTVNKKKPKFNSPMGLLNSNLEYEYGFIWNALWVQLK